MHKINKNQSKQVSVTMVYHHQWISSYIGDFRRALVHNTLRHTVLQKRLGIYSFFFGRNINNTLTQHAWDIRDNEMKHTYMHASMHMDIHMYIDRHGNFKGLHYQMGRCWKCEDKGPLKALGWEGGVDCGFLLMPFWLYDLEQVTVLTKVLLHLQLRFGNSCCTGRLWRISDWVSWPLADTHG